MKSKILGIFLLLFAVYTPISLFANIPPFSTDKEAYIYDSIPLLLNELPESVDVKEISEFGSRVITRNEIPNPEYYGLELTRKSHAEANLWYYPTIFIFFACIIGGIFLIVRKAK